MMRLRPAAEADRAAVRALLDAAHRHYFGAALPDDALDHAVADIVDRGEVHMVLAADHTGPLGFATYVILQASANGYGTLFLKDLFVDPAHRGAGLGREIMAHLARLAADRGCARFDWTAESDNPRAVALYDALGAERVTEKVYFRVKLDDMDRFIAACDSAGS